jgi:hypothetical protein
MLAASEASPAVFSSITRSIMLFAKVTPAAFMTCRSMGESRRGEDPVCDSVASMQDPRSQLSSAGALRTMSSTSSRSSNADIVTAARVMSTRRSCRTVTIREPLSPGTRARPTRLDPGT